MLYSLEKLFVYNIWNLA